MAPPSIFIYHHTMLNPTISISWALTLCRTMISALIRWLSKDGRSLWWSNHAPSPFPPLPYHNLFFDAAGPFTPIYSAFPQTPEAYWVSYVQPPKLQEFPLFSVAPLLLKTLTCYKIEIYVDALTWYKCGGILPPLLNRLPSSPSVCLTKPKVLETFW